MKPKFASIFSAFLLAAGLFGTVQTHAATLYDNSSPIVTTQDDSLGTGWDPANVDIFGSPFPFNPPLYNSFLTGNSTYSFDSVSLVIFSPLPSIGGTFNISILSDNSGDPGATVLRDSGTLADNVLSTSASLYAFSFSPLSLDPNTRYWVRLSASAENSDCIDNLSGCVFWAWWGNTSGPGVIDGSYGSQAGIFPNNILGESAPYQMLVEANATPIPAALPLFITGLVVMGLFGWGRKRILPLSC